MNKIYDSWQTRYKDEDYKINPENLVVIKILIYAGSLA